MNDTVLGTTACENVAVGATETATPVAPELGVTLVTVGAATRGHGVGRRRGRPGADRVGRRHRERVASVPLVSPVTVVEVAGGLPVTVTGVCAVEPMNGVTV